MTIEDTKAREKAATPLTDEEYTVWKGNIEAIAEAEAGEWYKREGDGFVPVQREEGDPVMTTTVGIQLRLFATIDDLLAQLRDRDEMLEAVGKINEEEGCSLPGVRLAQLDSNRCGECGNCRLDRILHKEGD